jgi:hypothetical protein
VLYIDGTFLKKEIPIRTQLDLHMVSIVSDIVCYIVYDIVCVYFDLFDIVYDILYDIVYDIVCNMESDSVSAVGCLNNHRSVLAKTYA